VQSVASRDNSKGNDDTCWWTGYERKRASEPGLFGGEQTQRGPVFTLGRHAATHAPSTTE